MQYLRDWSYTAAYHRRHQKHQCHPAEEVFNLADRPAASTSTVLLYTNYQHFPDHTAPFSRHQSFINQRFYLLHPKMAIPKRRNQAHHDFPAAKKLKTNISFTLKDFMEDLPMNEPVTSENPLPSTVLSEEEMQRGTQTKPTLRSTFNIELPLKLEEYNKASVQNAPFRWMKNQYAHCIIPEQGEEYDFDFDSATFHTLRDLHNARVRIRDGDFVPDDMICSLSTRWVSLEERDRPASDGYLAKDEIFVTTCLPLSNSEDELEKYFESNYLVEPSAQYYIPRSKYSVHFVGEPLPEEGTDIQSVKVGSVLIRNSRTGDVIHIDTGALTITSRRDRARTAGQVLRSWLEFQKKKCPKASLGPVSGAEPLILDVNKETDPTLGSLHALVSASLFLRRGITNWGEVKVFKARNAPNSSTMADYALQNISGWLGLKSTAKTGEKRPRNPTKAGNTFRDNHVMKALFGREHPAPVSERINLAQKGELFVYNEETELGDNASDDGDSSNESSSDRSQDSVDNYQDATVSDRLNTSQEAQDDDESISEESNDEEPNEEVVNKEEPNNEVSNNEVSNKQEPAKKKSVSWKEPEHEEFISKESISKEPDNKEPDSKQPSSNESSSKESDDEETNGDDPNPEDLKGEKSSNGVDGQTSYASA